MLNMNINAIYKAKFEEDDENVSKFLYWCSLLSLCLLWLLIILCNVDLEVTTNSGVLMEFTNFISLLIDNQRTRFALGKPNSL